MDLDLNGRCALVTGASAGIGRATALALAREGATVIATARRAALLEYISVQARDTGGQILPFAADLATAEALHRFVGTVQQAAGPINIVVNCAGGTRPVALDASEEDWEEAFSVNFTAARRLASAMLPAMKHAGWGRIINVTGILEPIGLNAAVAAKAALNLWSKGIARDVARHGVTVNCIGPGRILTEQIRDKVHPTEESRQAFAERYIPMGRFGEPSDVADLIVFLASPRASYITGAWIPVDGGMRRGQ
ncbi:SDR family oxidoreductase [Mesorhizobium sp. LHD-90]|uniref:SDR family NAD(P)-dependent oxidoreductase n=1 Tax=Mesorhizobium sp. LHD-90 TaxID=3071414 RepID=UPI0027E0A7F0|nr:SDR family oxidoreductase [Mesorhizobium sp. LHD-90]MDQ6433214.1 SDR family oxidoreductase [Mesorhizobium sp. LHD-90]